MASSASTPERTETQGEPEVSLCKLLDEGASSADPGFASSCLSHTSTDVRCLAAAVLGRIGAPAAGALTAALDPAQPDEVRALAAAGIAGIGPAAASSVRPLCRCLTSENPKLREVSALALGKIGQPSVASLRLMLQFTSTDAVAAAVEALALIGPPAGECAGELEQLALRSAPALRMTCVAAVSRVTGDLARGVPALLRALDEPDPQVRTLALKKLGEIGERVQPALQRLLLCSGDPIPSVRAETALTLGRIRAPYAYIASVLNALLQDPAPEARLNAAIALASYGPAARDCVPALQRATADPDESVAAACKAAVEMIEKPV